MPKPFEAFRNHSRRDSGSPYINKLLRIKHRMRELLPYIERAHDISGRGGFGKFLRHLAPAFHFRVIGAPAEGTAEHDFDSVLRVGVRLSEEAFGPEFRLACDKRI